MKRVFYSFGADEVLRPPIDDDSGDWLVGAQRYFVGAAIAATIASNALAAQITVAANNQPNEWVPAPSFNIDEDYQLPSAPQSLARVPVAFSADDDFVSPAATAFLDDDGTWQITIPRAQRPIQGFIADDEYAPTLLFDEENQPTPIAPLASRPVLPVALDEEYVHPAIEEDVAPLSSTRALPIARAFIIDDEYSPTITVDESEQPFVASAQPRPPVIPLGQEDDLPVVPSIAIDESDAPLVLLPARQARVGQPFLDDDVLPVPSLEEFDGPVVARSQPARAPLQLLAADEYAPAPGLDDDYYWPRFAQPAVRASLPIALDDELPVLAVDESDAPAIVIRGTLRISTPLITDDEFAPVATVLAAEDDGWLPPFRAQPSRAPLACLLARANTDDARVPPFSGAVVVRFEIAPRYSCMAFTAQPRFAAKLVTAHRYTVLLSASPRYELRLAIGPTYTVDLEE